MICEPRRISVCICTYKRPVQLEALLQALASQQLKDAADEIEIVVADNDPARSAQPVLTRWQARETPRVCSISVPVPNIALARNATVEHATGQWIAFIDDDEIPKVDWLSHLMLAQQRFSADAVFAPVVPRYLEGTPDWLVRGGYFERRRFPSGTRIDEKDARTGNVLIRAAILRAQPGPFDADFGRTGGEDSMLFRDLLNAQARFIWCDEAPVEEDVPLNRACATWLMQRSYRVGQTWIRGELYRSHGMAFLARALYLFTRAGVQLLTGLMLALICAPWSRTRSFNWLRIAIMQAGKLTGLSRFQFKEYGQSAEK